MNGGNKYDGGKVMMQLLPPEALFGTARVLTYGAKKYAPRNWEKGIEYSRVYGALQRHLWAWWNGEINDPESGLPHLDHAGCCLMFLQTFEQRSMEQYNDKPTTPARAESSGSSKTLEPKENVE